MKEISEKLVKKADSIEDLATKICGYGYYAYHNDDRDHPIPKDAVREYLEMGAALNRRQMTKCAVDGEILMDNRGANYISAKVISKRHYCNHYEIKVLIIDEQKD